MLKYVVKFVVKCVVKSCGEIEKLLDWNKYWCGSIYGPPNYDRGLWQKFVVNLW